MRLVGGELRLSAGDLSGHLGCRHRTVLDEECARGTRKAPPVYPDAIGDLLRERGFAHEAAYVQSLGDDAVSLDHEKDPAATLAAMRRGVPLIVQPTLAHGRWLGRADILRRVDERYEVIDTKLSAETRAATILQLCLYTELVAHMFGKRADVFHVVSPHPIERFHTESYRFDEYAAYYRHVRDRLATWRDPGTTYPDPVEACDFCRWWQTCDARHRTDDSTWLVAGISRTQKKELDAAQLGKLALLARANQLPDDSFDRVQLQARMQLEGRETGQPVHTLLPVEPDRGFSRLPAPSPGDVFFDLEGDRMGSTEGREFLWGVVHDGTYHAQWAMTDADERAAFEHAIDLFTARIARYPDAHIYHYAPYEPAALKRLMGRYGTREDELDALLRGERFVDLCSLTKQSLRASVERYSIKDLERFYGFVRTGDLRQAGPAVRAVRLAIASGATHTLDADTRTKVEVYNREDCESTEHLRDWLESIRPATVARPVPKDGDPSEELDAERAEVQAIVDQLCANEPPGSPRWLLAQMLEYHRREAKVHWWEHFRLAALTPDEALDERSALGGLTFVERFPGKKKNVLPVDRYTYPAQDHDLKPDDDLCAGEKDFGKVVAIDTVARTIDIKTTKKRLDEHPDVVFSHPFINPGEKKKSLRRLADDVLAGRDPGPAWKLLHRTPPRAFTVLALDGDVLPIQGPPGTGKTYTAGRMILDLVRAGKKVGVTALSHKVIRNVLNEVAAHVRCLHKCSDDDDDGPVRVTDSNDEAATALTDGEIDVLGGTAWLWSREDLRSAVDVLIVDEAGQMSLADTLAVAQAARSLVLVGDPRQLEQPQQGSHPDGAEVSALEHLFGGAMTVPADRGLFLGTTHRMAPALCAFTSEQFYENRLQGIPALATQSIVGKVPYAGTGLFYVPVDHTGNQNHSPEEVAAVVRLVADLLTCSWTNKDGKTSRLTPADILVVAPYNAQVDLLSAALPVPCGTVDKFQGQQAPVVIFSAATSTPDDAPRGMEFLYSLNRLNVATSRARCVCLFVASPRLFEPECKTPRQIRLANAWCRYLELATRVELP